MWGEVTVWLRIDHRSRSTPKAPLVWEPPITEQDDNGAKVERAEWPAYFAWPRLEEVNRH